MSRTILLTAALPDGTRAWRSTTNRALRYAYRDPSNWIRWTSRRDLIPGGSSCIAEAHEATAAERAGYRAEQRIQARANLPKVLRSAQRDLERLRKRAQEAPEDLLRLTLGVQLLLCMSWLTLDERIAHMNLNAAHTRAFLDRFPREEQRLLKLIARHERSLARGA